MDTQLENLEGHRARVTVNVDDETLIRGQKLAAKRIAKDLRIPGFRPGKAPYEVIVQYLGEETIAQEALEDIGNDIYREALEAAEVEPYAPGEIVDFKLEDGLTLVFEFPKSPDVDLKNYRDIRLEYEAKVPTDHDIEHQLEHTIEDLALTEIVNRPAELNDQVVINVRGTYEGDPEPEEDADTDSAAEPATDKADSETDETPPQATEDAATDDPVEAGETAATATEDETVEAESTNEVVYIDENQMELIVSDDNLHDIVPGFAVNLISMAAGDEKTFELTVPDDAEEEHLHDLRGKTVEFKVSIIDVQNVIKPAQDDFLAELATQGEVTTLDELREKVREQLSNSYKEQADDAFASQVIEKIVEQADFEYPEEAVEDYQQDVVNELSRLVEQQIGLSFDNYLQMVGKTRQDMMEENRDRAIQRMQNSLVLTAIAEQEGLSVDDDDVDAEIEKQLEQYNPEDADIIRNMLNTEMYREQLAVQLVSQNTVQRIIAIARGEAPPLEAPEADESDAHGDSPETLSQALESAEASNDNDTEHDVATSSKTETSEA